MGESAWAFLAARFSPDPCPPGAPRPQPPMLPQLHVLNFCHPPRAGLFLPLAGEFLEFTGFVFLISEPLVSAHGGRSKELSTSLWEEGISKR